jgi:hypothetical protein
MFGLMKRPPRMPYCGTCKTMGARYGQKSRLLLNNDTVFLAELLLEYGGAPEWSSAYRSFNCVAMPAGQDVPLALDFAAAATIVLAHFRIEDHRIDSGKRVWGWAARLLSPSYRRAAARLRDWNFPLAELAQTLATQGEREAHPESLAHVGEPTAHATALFFSEGARLIGRQDLAEQMYRMGHRFGFLIYSLDALEDRARDEKLGQFNPLAALPGVDARAEILAALVDLERELPQSFALRLRSNVEERLGMRPRVWTHRCRKGVRERWRDAVAFARTMNKEEGLAALAVASVVAFLFPHHVRSAESLKHSLGLGMNLMALGAILNAAVPPPPPPPPPPPGNYRPQVAIPPGGGYAPRGSFGGSFCGSCCGSCCGECACEGCCGVCEGCGACCELGECCSNCSCDC